MNVFYFIRMDTGAGSLVGRPLSSLDAAEDGLTSTISGFRRPSPRRCSVRGAEQFEHHTTVHSHHEQRSKSARTALLDAGRTGKECAADGLADYLEERSEVESSSCPTKPATGVAQRAFYPQWHAARGL
jgi:hypothetical protein